MQKDIVPAFSMVFDEAGSPARLTVPGVVDLVLVDRPDDVEQVFLRKQDVYTKGPGYDVPALGLREGLVTSRRRTVEARPRDAQPAVRAPAPRAPGVNMAKAAAAHWRSRRIAHRISEADEMISRIIEARQSAAEAPTTDFLGLLLGARDEDTGHTLTRAELLEQSLTFLGAGTRDHGHRSGLVLAPAGGESGCP